MRLEDALHTAKVLAEIVDPKESRADAFWADNQFADDPMIHIGVGIKRDGGREADVKIAIRAWTRDDLSKFRAFALEGMNIPESELDVIVTGEIVAGIPEAFSGKLAGVYTNRCRPILHPGVSIGHIHGPPGTLGALVHLNGKKHILSCNHVIAKCTSAANPSNVKKGDIIVQQAVTDGGAPPPVGYLSRWSLLRATRNKVDGALAVCDEQLDWDPKLPTIGHIRGMREAVMGEIVQKVGRTTGHRRGRVDATLYSIPVKYGRNIVCRFDDVVEIADLDDSFAAPGDSGSVVVTLDQHACGLLFAGSPGRTLLNPIIKVASDLGFSDFLGA